MKFTAILLYYTSVLYTPKGHTAQNGERPGEVSCRVRTYAHDNGTPGVEGIAILEESHTIIEDVLEGLAKKRRASTWDESDIRTVLSKKLKLEVE